MIENRRLNGKFCSLWSGIHHLMETNLTTPSAEAAATSPIQEGNLSLLSQKRVLQIRDNVLPLYDGVITMSVVVITVSESVIHKMR